MCRCNNSFRKGSKNEIKKVAFSNFHNEFLSQ